MADLYKIEDVMHKDGFWIPTPILFGITPQTAANYNTFWTTRFGVEPLWICIRYSVNAGVPATLDIKKVPNGTSIASGTSILVSTFDLNSTANTNIIKLSTELNTSRQLDPGYSLGFISTGVVGSTLQNLEISIYAKRLGKGDYL